VEAEEGTAERLTSGSLARPLPPPPHVASRRAGSAISPQDTEAQGQPQTEKNVRWCQPRSGRGLISGRRGESRFHGRDGGTGSQWRQARRESKNSKGRVAPPSRHAICKAATS
jgi:hypothetical protein